MRFLILCLFLMISGALSKTATKSLTESMGQEVIEIGAPMKDLPGELEEEPSAEKDDDDVTTVSVQPATKKDMKKTTMADVRKRVKDVDKIDGINRLQSEDDEERVEKELADIYKDNDYKGESEESVTSENTVDNKPILRQKGRSADKPIFGPEPEPQDQARSAAKDDISCRRKLNDKVEPQSQLSPSQGDIYKLISSYKFQPDPNNPTEVEEFRTALDDIGCENTASSLVRKGKEADDPTRLGSQHCSQSSTDVLLFFKPFSLIIVLVLIRRRH